MFNNPLMYNDPSGEAWFIPFIIAVAKGAAIGAAVGAGIYIVQAAITGNFSFKDFGKSILMGAISGAVSGGISHFNLFTSSGLVGGGILNGMLGGSITGGIDSLINGTSFVKGVFKGAIVGGIIGGVTGLIQRLTLKPQEIGVQNNGEIVTSTGERFKDAEDLIKFTNENVGNYEAIKKELNIDRFISGEGASLKGKTSMYKVVNGKMYKYDLNALKEPINGQLSKAGGVAIHSGGFFSKLKTSILINPSVKGIYYNGASLAKMVINHEFIHAYHNSIGVLNTTYTERSANSYSMVYMKHHKVWSQYNFYKNKVLDYGGFNIPSSYKWNVSTLRKLLKLF